MNEIIAGQQYPHKTKNSMLAVIKSAAMKKLLNQFVEVALKKEVSK
ncbi:MAG: hypothetical protein IPK96_00185 [Flammeovirgaceae bacterium]|nr:hypothetical protein [Flammeovirgaceae bacterium]